MRTNSGYEIISAIRISETEEIVLGHMKSKLCGDMYVTWDCTYGDNYFWGHYFNDFAEARNDQIIRAANICGLELVKEATV